METKPVAACSDSRLTPHASPRFRALPPLALYIHVPWCARKCPYCDFNSHEARGAVPQERYVAALIADLEQALPQVWGRRVCSIFFGGGTPSLFSAQSIAETLSAVHARLPVEPDAEVTLEANPGTFETEKFRDFRAAGVNRLSIGIQSFDPRRLKALGRIHDGDEARRAIEIAKRYFANVNLDIMYGLPAQTVEDALADIDAAISFSPQHVSAYHLTIEPNTHFHRFPPQLPDEGAMIAMQEAIEAELAAAGYGHYETSAFARRREARGERGEERKTTSGVDPASFLSPLPSPGGPHGAAYCRHNLNYWTFGDYLGIGAGAHSKLSFPDRVLRQARARHPERYMEAAEHGCPIQEHHNVRTDDLPFEFMMNALRLNEGFPVSLFEERTGLQLTAVQLELEDAERRNLIERDHLHIAPTPLGRRFLNDLLQVFLPGTGCA